jgi:pyruvate oxidase
VAPYTIHKGSEVKIVVIWKCTVCGYLYDETTGEPATGTPPGTPFGALPEDWQCPICRAGKEAFVRVEQASPHAAAATTVSDVIIGELAAWGVQFVFSIPGTSSLGLVDAVRKNPAIRYIVVRHEANAAFAASAYNKLTGKIAACLTIAGPGATNLATGLYDAKEDHASIISLNGQVDIQYTGPGGFQEIDQDAFFRPITVFNNTIYDPTMTVKLVSSALKCALVERGVAQLSVPNDIQKQPLDAAVCARESCAAHFDIIPDTKEIQSAATLMNQAKRPVIIAGWGAYHETASVLAIARTIKAPILSTFRAKGMFPDASEWYAGILGNVGSSQARNLVNRSDLLITFGVGFSKMTNVPTDKPMVQVDLDPLKLGKAQQGMTLYGNCSLVLPALLSFLQERDDSSVLPEIAALKKAWDRQRDLEADPNAIPLRPPYIMKALSDLIPDDAVITIDVGENGWWFGRNFRMKRQRMVMSGYLATMGFGFPAAIAAKLACPDKAVICITGDGGFSQAMADFVTAVKYRLPMVVVILNNHELGMIRVEQKLEQYQNFGTDLHNPDFVLFAEACGGVGIPVKKPEDLAPAVRRALSLDHPVILDIETDPNRF